MISTSNRPSMPIWVILLLFAGGVLLGLTVSFIISAGQPVHLPESIVTEDKSTIKQSHQDKAGKAKPPKKQAEAGKGVSPPEESSPITQTGSR